MKIVPSDKFDFEACNNLLSASDEDVIKNIDELLEWLQDMNWPVAPKIIERLKLIEEPLITPIQNILSGNDDIWKYWIISALLRQTTSNIVTSLKDDLNRIITNPTKNEINEEVNIVARELLNK